tara:strand:- start:2309 stop:2422 length:114 start_codon:yes stop_codon:yes gene_type:complete
MSFKIRESIMAYWEMFKFFAIVIGFCGIIYLLAKELR